VIPTALATALLLAAQATPAAPRPASAAQGVLRTGVPGPGAPAPAVDLSPRPPGASHAGGETRCALCHTAEGWKKVGFSHDKTGFPLTGRHRDVTCTACHPGGDFGKPVPRACAACHRDVHARRLVQRCDRCHDTASFQQASFGPDAHRRTAFPLTGRHASLPCEECHGDRRDRAFSRPVARCVGCHQQDYDRTTADPRLLDHVLAGFPTDCRTCHGTWRFRPGAFPAHEACFAIRAGPHAGIGCRDCHTGGVPPFVAGQAFACSPIPASVPPADCMHCHGNPAAAHQGVAGYLPSNPRCYECHRFSSGLPRSTGGAR
jgi:hypothetical protein